MKKYPQISSGRLLASAAAAVALALASLPAGAGSLTVIENGNDDGDGSLRKALSSGDSHIYIPASVQVIFVRGMPLSYAGTEPLTIVGSGQKIQTLEGIDLLQITEGADLTISDVHFEGAGGYSIENPGDGMGILLDVPSTREGVVRLNLSDVSISGVAYHGVLVSDCDDDEDCGAGQGGGGGGSPASVEVVLNRVTITDAGNGRFDGDGLRVNERDEGGISFFAERSRFFENGADGVELDEDDTNDSVGHVTATISRSVFNKNGAYCNPALLKEELKEQLDGLPVEDDDLGPDEVSVAAITPKGTSDDECFEVEFEEIGETGFVSEYEISIDTDDGIDFDEAGKGSINATIEFTEVSGNYDEGVDFDEAGSGGFIASFIQTKALNNSDDGFKLSEEDAGDVIASLYDVQARGNGGKGAVFEEANDGDLEVAVERSITHRNDDNEVGIEVLHEDAGTGVLAIRGSNIKETEGNNGDGIEFEDVTVVFE